MNIAEYTDSLKDIISNSDLRDRVLGLTACMMADLKPTLYVAAKLEAFNLSEESSMQILGVFKSKAEAEAYVRNDMEDMCDVLAPSYYEVDFDGMQIVTDDSVFTWSISEKKLQ